MSPQETLAVLKGAGFTLTRPLVSFDLETTGTDTQNDRVVCFGMFKVLPSDLIIQEKFLINPGIPIPPEATAVHGITNEMVSGMPRFVALYRMILGLLGADYDLVGYNCLGFDVPLLMAELSRVSSGAVFPCRGCRIIDPFSIFKQKETRTLAAAVRRYCGREPERVHDAASDAQEALNVLLGMREAYPDIKTMSLDDLAVYCKGDSLDVLGKLRRTASGDVIWNFGRHEGKRVKDEPAYARWVLESDFPADTKEIISGILRTGSRV